MIPYDIDPSLHSGEPDDQLLLDDGFSAPRSHGESAGQPGPQATASLEEALASKSDF
ncbi:MAG: hypothetical protein JWQ13_2124 [Ramlibacter sp.]|jgi:hypothetical protein|uniref:hypothetical protein n=1 Tax=Ramlibacter sp. TaxID=1917967 RepID=UPI002608FA19|nr:hypothetical protein [Ramlibacter sp.]MDB5749619.1 hypothetical protein [Ramlibacter sp.]MDB5942558.1 hypothetical protein [Ramlibacter sp.]